MATQPAAMEAAEPMGTVTLNEGEISGNNTSGVGGAVRGTLYMNGRSDQR